MKEISITNKELDYGIDADSVFWVAQGILTKDHLRQSQDEGAIADILAYMLSDEAPASRTELLDHYYGTPSKLTGAAKERHDAIDAAIRVRNAELVISDYQKVHDELELLLEQAQTTFSKLLFPGDNNPLPRYFQAVFLAIHDLIVKKNLTFVDRAGAITKLKDSGKNIPMQEGGRWGADNRSAAVSCIAGWLTKYCEEIDNPDPTQTQWVTKLENLLTNSKTEQSAYDYKQGFFNLADQPNFDEPSFNKILQTCASIANIGRGYKGYVLVGVAETGETAIRVETRFNVSAHQFSNFYITGVEHEARASGKNLDEYFRSIIDKISRSTLSEPLRTFIGSHLKCIRYYEKALFVFEVRGQNEPSLFDGKFFLRQGPSVQEIKPENLATLFSRFN